MNLPRSACLNLPHSVDDYEPSRPHLEPHPAPGKPRHLTVSEMAAWDRHLGGKGAAPAPVELQGSSRSWHLDGVYAGATVNVGDRRRGDRSDVWARWVEKCRKGAAEIVELEETLVAVLGPAVEGDDFEAASQAYWRSLGLVKLDGRRVLLPQPTPEEIARHVKRHGSEGMEVVEPAQPSPVSLRAQGYSVDEIATSLKMPVKKVREALVA